MSLKLYSYWRSSASYRVRIALHLKGLSFETIPVHLLNNGGEQHQAPYAALNPQELVPTLLHDDKVITQSMAAIEYLDEIYPSPSLVYGDAAMRARIRQLSLVVVADTHPILNLRILQQLSAQFAADEEAKLAWQHRWLKPSFDALEKLAAPNMPFLCGNTPSMADCCLIPQIYNARRFKFALDAYPQLRKIDENCLKLEAFQKASPEVQPDAAV